MEVPERRSADENLGSMMPPAHYEWLQKWAAEVQADYRRLHDLARQDPQRSGHGGESGWLRLLSEWLPPAYEVGLRKYIVPEVGTDAFETDIVVFNPGYPLKLREREEVLAGGVVAAFSVKLTVDAAGLRDAVERCARLKRAMKLRKGSPRSEMVGSLACGVLGHSHAWKKPGSTPRQNLEDHLHLLDGELIAHPRESLDLVCIADLATAWTARVPAANTPKDVEDLRSGVLDPDAELACVATMLSDEHDERVPVASFVAALMKRLALTDPALSPFVDGLEATETLGPASGFARYYERRRIFTDDVAAELLGRLNSSPDWASVF